MGRTFTVLMLCLITLGCATGGGNAQLSSTDPGAVLDKTWQWTVTKGPQHDVTVIAPERYTIFLADGRAQVKFDCNGGGGTYKISQGKLSFGPMMSTKMFCRDSQDIIFADNLQQVAAFKVEGGVLYLTLTDNQTTMQFRQAPNE
ncbi:protein of unknown function DUF306 Meta and HslJ [Desulfatibacillum aliphaticivorans]|uniref:DUF306 domain-containing protein n=1 Tax=Desulfatibacillum aliphaticivorans TaxID=218208 RepID=B8F964_DESAL|nr:META domain-containing protein [Desulfatibacillum aliphaticivorans]ACL02810.1 protein of unknown function DUF306 Meta and HslJ [Desulfatibacillum aliphaticivorans]